MFICRSCVKRATINPLCRLPATQNIRAATPKTFATSSLWRQDPEDGFTQLKPAVEKVAPADTPSQKKLREKMMRAIRKELRYTTDPFHIASNVVKKLQEDNFEQALMLTREASRDRTCVVSWNHLIEYQFKNGKLHGAIKLFNEMKKRGQMPNAQTFTIIFTGCAKSNHPKLAVSEALKIYNAMLYSSRIHPNTIHLNAVLDACARAQDLESMFVILQSATHIRAPNNLTYTIILNALRYQKSNFFRPSDGPYVEVKKTVLKSVQTTIKRARLVWDEVMSRWKKGEITMDEELMCAMGRILILTGRNETDAILALTADVMGIPRLADDAPASPKNDSVQSPQQQQQPQLQGPSKPMGGNNTLSLIMRALANSRRTKLAAKYWDYLTQKYGIVPDQMNYVDYLNALSTGASSGKAAQVISGMPSNLVTAPMLRCGLLMCLFDRYNVHAFENATTIFDFMLQNMKVPDSDCMKLYLQIAAVDSRRFRGKATCPEEEKANFEYGRKMFSAVDRVFEPLRLVTNDLSYSAESTTLSKSPEANWKRNQPERQLILGVARKLVSVSDKIITQSLIPKGGDMHRVTITRRTIMMNYVVRCMEKSQQYGQGGRRHVGRKDADVAAG